MIPRPFQDNCLSCVSKEIAAAKGTENAMLYCENGVTFLLSSCNNKERLLTCMGLPILAYKPFLNLPKGHLCRPVQRQARMSEYPTAFYKHDKRPAGQCSMRNNSFRHRPVSI